MKHEHPETINESDESEITILPDGRIYAFGITRPLVELLASLSSRDERLRRMLDHLTDPAMPELSQNEVSE